MKLAILLASMAVAIVLGFNYSLNNVVASNQSVNVGGNGSLWDSFTPKNVEIKVGEIVTWINPMMVSEPHTVTFITDQSFFAPPATPFSVSNSSELKSLSPPDQNISPLMIDLNGSKAIIVDNARHYNPVAIDSTGKNVTYLPVNANYSMVGTEKYVNSGWIWPEGLAPPGVPPIKSFSVTFEQPGTYHYICSVHPWMAGTVKVS